LVPGSHFESDAELCRYETLLQMADLVVSPSDLRQLFREVSQRLRQVISFDLIVFTLHNPASNKMQLRYCESSGTDLEQIGELPVEEAPSGWVWLNQSPLIIPDLAAEVRFERGLRVIRQAGIRSYFCLPLTVAEKRLGGIGLGCSEVHFCEEKDLRLLQRVAEIVSLAIESAQSNSALQQEKERMQMLLEVNAALVPNLDLPQLFPSISGFIRKVVKQDYARLSLSDEQRQTLSRYVTDWPGMNGNCTIATELSLKESGPGRAFLERKTKVYSREELIALRSTLIDNIEEVQWLCSIPLLTRTGAVGTINFARRDTETFSDQDHSLLKQIAGQIAIAMDNARAYREIAALTERLSMEKLYLQDEIRTAHNFKEILGSSSELLKLLDRMEAVAPTDANVLITGETGSGKELVARAIHSRSAREKSPLVKVNCGAIPTGLVESELFGHVKGAFTSASDRRVGRFELANGGTLFLDEVGELPLETQVKLLRVLQEQEFEPVGSSRTIKVNVRIIAATNRDLERAVQSGAFRSDLYYRLNVVPLRVPGLRERRSDIPQLVISFLEQSARRMGKSVASVSQKTMDLLMDYPWPGNIRELQNVIERGVVLSRGSMLKLGADLLPVEADHDASDHEVPYEPDTAGTLESIQRQHILRVLNQTGWLVSGPNGAGAILDLHPNTLHSIMKRLGISRPIHKDS